MDDGAFAHIEAGYEHLTKSRFKSALVEFERAKLLAPDEASPCYYLGYAHLGMDDKKNAMREFEQAAHLDPNDAWTYLTMGATQLEQGNLPAGRELLNMAGELPGGPGIRLLARGYLAYNDKKYQEALSQFNAAAEWIMDCPGLAECRALALYRLKRNLEAVEILRQAARHPAATASTFSSLGMAELRLRNHEAVAEAYERAYLAYQQRLEDNPGDREALLTLTGIGIYFGRWRSAWSYLRRAIKS